MSVDDFLFACSADHPRRDLIYSSPVQSVRLQGPFVSLANVASSMQRVVFGVDMTAAGKRGDCARTRPKSQISCSAVTMLVRCTLSHVRERHTQPQTRCCSHHRPRTAVTWCHLLKCWGGQQVDATFIPPNSKLRLAPHNQSARVCRLPRTTCPCLSQVALTTRRGTAHLQPHPILLPDLAAIFPTACDTFSLYIRSHDQ